MKTGGRLRTWAGELTIERVEQVALDAITHKEAKRAGFANRDDLVGFLTRRPSGELYRTEVKYAGEDSRIALRNQSKVSAGEIKEIIVKLDRMDRASWHGPWPRTTLSLIDTYPARLAKELAQEMNFEKPVFKRNVRKLKELGLTESLEVGYWLSPRGKTVHRALGKSELHRNYLAKAAADSYRSGHAVSSQVL